MHARSPTLAGCCCHTHRCCHTPLPLPLPLPLQVTNLAVSGTARVQLKPLLPEVPGFGAAVVSLMKVRCSVWSASVQLYSCVSCGVLVCAWSSAAWCRKMHSVPGVRLTPPLAWLCVIYLPCPLIAAAHSRPLSASTSTLARAWAAATRRGPSRSV